MTYKEKLNFYDQLVDKFEHFERKGKSMPYTSANGHMFSLLNKDGELGFRYSKEVQEKYMGEFNTTLFKSYNSVMKGYILIHDEMLSDEDLLVKLLQESFDYVMSLPSK